MVRQVLEGALWALQREPAEVDTGIQGGRGWLQVAFKLTTIEKVYGALSQCQTQSRSLFMIFGQPGSPTSRGSFREVKSSRTHSLQAGDMGFEPG